MKNSIWVMLLVCFLIGCKDFLEEQSQTEIRPSSVQDMEKLLEGEAYWDESYGKIFSDVTDIFTDDVESQIVRDQNETKKRRNRYKYAWDEVMFEDNGDGADISLWQRPYTYIMGANVILDYLDDVENQLEEDPVLREHIRGEALVLRGFYHFHLVNFFGLPYNFGNPEENPGIPLRLRSGVDTDEYPRRASVADCYRQIIRDLEEGSKLMSENRAEASTKETRIDYVVGYALLSRVYLYMEDWDEVIRYADSVLSVQPELLMFAENTGKTLFTGRTGNPENLWQMPAKMTNYDGTISVRKRVAPYNTSNELIGIYMDDLAPGERDFRLMDVDEDSNTSPGSGGPEIAYIMTGMEDVYDYDIGVLVEKIDFMTMCKALKWTGLRNAEVYLNRAEAYARKYVAEGNAAFAQAALNDLNNLRQHRMEPAGFVEKTMADFVDGQALLDFCLRERRRELCGEGNHRWFDLRRQGMPGLIHVFLDNDTGMETKYTLSQGDRHYALPIPREVLDRNPDLYQNVY